MIRLIFTFLFLLPSIVVSAPSNIVIYEDFDNASNTGHTFYPYHSDYHVNWTWYTEVFFAENGWREAVCRNEYWCQPRWHEKTDYDSNHSGADISGDYKWPGGGSNDKGLKIYHISGGIYPAWWFLTGDNYGSTGMQPDGGRGWTDGDTDRFSMYVYLHNFADPGLTSDPANYNFDMANYLCWDGAGLGGEDCPKEADGHHYYNRITASSDMWIHVLWDRHPENKRTSINYIDDPSYVTDGKHYYEYMDAFYLENSGGAGTAGCYFLVDEMTFYNETETQNELSITGLWVGYRPSTDKWEIGWFDMSTAGMNNSGRYQVRYSTSIITNENFSSATQIEPEYHEIGTTNNITEANGYKYVVWTSFELPDAIEANNNIIYFAAKDISSTELGDDNNSPSSYIKTIDYYLREDTVTPNKLSNITISVGVVK